MAVDLLKNELAPLDNKRTATPGRRISIPGQDLFCVTAAGSETSDFGLSLTSSWLDKVS